MFSSIAVSLNAFAKLILFLSPRPQIEGLEWRFTTPPVYIAHNDTFKIDGEIRLRDGSPPNGWFCFIASEDTLTRFGENGMFMGQGLRAYSIRRGSLSWDNLRQGKWAQVSYRSKLWPTNKRWYFALLELTHVEPPDGPKVFARRLGLVINLPDKEEE